MTEWHCECCIDKVCFCQGVDLLIADDDQIPWCRCCLERDCECQGDSVHE